MVKMADFIEFFCVAGNFFQKKSFFFNKKRAEL